MEDSGEGCSLEIIHGRRPASREIFVPAGATRNSRPRAEGARPPWQEGAGLGDLSPKPP